MAAGQAVNATDLADGLLRLLQLRYKRGSKKRSGEWLTASSDDGGGKGHRWMKGGQSPDTMFSALSGGISNNPQRVLQEKITQSSGIWKCDEEAAKRKRLFSHTEGDGQGHRSRRIG